MEITGVTYSVAHYEHYNQHGDSNYFEEIVDKMILDQVVGMNESFRRTIEGLSRDKKRMAILSLLEKDRSLFKKIKALIDKDINRMDHIKDVVLMLREYVKIADVEKSKFGEVMTPLDLIKEMINILPNETWSNPNLKWLDPANGTGPYPIMVIYKLMNGLKDWEPDDEKRYKHIVENMIYVCELQPKNMFLYMCAVDPFDKYKLNVYTGSFLEKEFDYHMKTVWNIQKIDIVIGNPPYQDEMITKKGSAKPLYNLFTEKSIDISNIISFITPSRWFAGGKGLDIFRNKMMSRKDIKIIKHFDDASSIFNNVEIKGGVSYFLIDKSYTGLTKFNEFDIDIKKYDIIPTSVSSDNFSLIDKFMNCDNISRICIGQGYSGVTSNDNRLTDTKLNDGDLTCYVSIKNGLKKYINPDKLKSIDTINSWKVFTARSSTKGGSGFGRHFYIGEPGEICNQSYIVFIVNSKEEAESLKSYLSTKFVNKMLSLRKITQDSKPDTCKWIPFVPFDRKWSDDLIFNYLNLEKNQIDLINSFHI